MTDKTEHDQRNAAALVGRYGLDAEAWAEGLGRVIRHVTQGGEDPFKPPAGAHDSIAGSWFAAAFEAGRQRGEQ